MKTKNILSENNQKIIKKLRPFLIIFFTIVMLVSLSLTAYHLYYWGRIYPGIRIAGIAVGGESVDEAAGQLAQTISVPEKITISSKDQSYDIKLADINFSYNYRESAQNAYTLYKSASDPVSVKNSFLTLYIKPEINLSYTMDQNKLKEYLSVISGQVSQEPVYPEVKFIRGKISIEKGQPGLKLNTDALYQIINNKFSHTDFSLTEIAPEVIDPTLTDAEIEAITQKANSLIGKSINAKVKDLDITIPGTDLATTISINGFSSERVALLADKVASQVNRKPQDAIFRFENGKVLEFLPAQNGLTVQKDILNRELIDALQTLDTTEDKTTNIDIPVEQTPPSTLTADVNNLGINERIGRGESKFAGSIASRIYNINLAASKFNGILIAPGDTLSFNQILGDVSALTGYKQAYIIQNGATVLGDGGGVCQVSTTLFRAALNAGLPIIERRAHAYRVGYYEQGSPPGLDATVYSPTTDFKIKNDTSQYILIQTKTDTKNLTLVFELYGTSDGRKSTITKSVVTGVTPPPEDLYIDDPTLPAGTIKQIDWKAWGAKVSFNYSVEKDGIKIYEKTFISNYRPWQAKFLRGTGPAI